MDTLETMSNTDDSLCRTCLKVISLKTEAVYLFDNYLDESASFRLVDFIVTFTSLQIDRSDELTSFICARCFEKLKEIHDFRRVCIASNEFLVEQKACRRDSINVKTEEGSDDVEPEFFKVNVDFVTADVKDEPEEFLEETKATGEDQGNDVRDRKSKGSCKSYDEQSEDGLKSDLIRITCEICQKMFLRQDNYDGHMRKHKGLEPFVCELCGRGFTKKASLKYHLQASHPKDGYKPLEYICGYGDCGKVYATRQSVKNHLFTAHVQHSGVPKIQRVICEHCGKSYASNTGLKKHSYSHTGVMPFKCHLCPKAFATTNKLKMHIMRHEGIKNHMCPVCGLRKTTMYELRVHMNSHTGEKQYACDRCSAVFQTNNNRTRHIQTVHLKVKGYPCTDCEKSFTEPYMLRRHILIHTGEKPYECEVCRKHFTQRSSLKAHARIHDKDRPTAEFVGT